MRFFTSLVVAGLFATASIAAEPTYTDTPTSDWFQSLSSPLNPNCCDQADCKRTLAEWRRDAVQREPEPGELAVETGHWWALSNRTHTWVMITDDQLTRDKQGGVVVSILGDAVLCEGTPWPNTDGPSTPKIYCLSPPASAA